MQIMKLDEPNKNGRTYSSEIVAGALTKVKRPLFGTLGMKDTGSGTSYVVNVEDISHQFSNLHVKDGWMCGNLTVLETPNGKILSSLMTAMPDGIVFRSAGYAKMDPNGVVTEFELIQVAALTAENAA